MGIQTTNMVLRDFHRSRKLCRLFVRLESLLLRNELLTSPLGQVVGRCAEERCEGMVCVS